MTEEWRPVLRGWYEVSNLGRVRSVDRMTADGRRWKGKLLKQCLDGGKYLMFCASINGKKSNPCTHVLVARAFLGPRPPGRVVNHKDGDNLYNASKNLEYVTQKKNQEHASAMGLMPTKANGRWHRP
jgi:hypothetical protein